MEISPFLLTLLLSWSFVWGAMLGVINDINRIIRVFCGVRYTGKSFDRLYEIKLPIINSTLKRRENKFHKGVVSVLIFFQDIVFFLIAGTGIIILNYEYNEGRFRFFTVLAVIVGFVLYYFTVGKLVLTISECIVFAIKAVFVIIFGLIWRPSAFLGHILAKKMKKIILFFNIAIANIQKKLYNIYRKNKLLKKSEKGFLNMEK